MAVLDKPPSVINVKHIVVGWWMPVGEYTTLKIFEFLLKFLLAVLSTNHDGRVGQWLDVAFSLREAECWVN